MTTGRINQVTISIYTTVRDYCIALVLMSETFSIVGVRYKALYICLYELIHSYK